MVEESAYFGPFLAVIDGSPLKVGVNYQQLRPDSGDRSGEHPYYYHFNADPPILRGDFIVNSTSTLLEYYFKNNPKEFHFSSIKFGISKLRESIMDGTHKYTPMEHELLLKRPRLQANKLRHAILDFINSINQTWPREEIKADDIELNFNANKEEIMQWLLSLADEDLLIQNRIDNAPNPFSKGKRGIYVYRINPRNSKKVENDLKEHPVNDKGRPSDGYSRLKIFFSYSSRNKKLSGQIKDEFERLGMEVFLAHEDIKVSKKWEERILQELRECDIFVGLITRQFMISDWTYQEAGNAIGSDKAIVSIIHGGELKGFLKRFQFVKFSRDRGKRYFRKIVNFILDEESLRNRFIYSAIQGLKESENYLDSIEIAQTLMEIKNLDERQIDQIIECIIENDQVHRSVGAMKLLTPLLAKNKDRVSEHNKKLLSDNNIAI